jgi:hypothetical protein
VYACTFGEQLERVNLDCVPEWQKDECHGFEIISIFNIIIFDLFYKKHNLLESSHISKHSIVCCGALYLVGSLSKSFVATLPYAPCYS